MAFSLDRKCPRLIDFFYNLAKLVSGASFEVAMALVSLLCSSWVKLTAQWQPSGDNDE